MVNFIDRFILFILFLHISYSYDSKVELPLLLEKSCFVPEQHHIVLQATSMPHVFGVVAVWCRQHPLWSASGIQGTLGSLSSLGATLRLSKGKGLKAPSLGAAWPWTTVSAESTDPCRVASVLCG